MMHSALLKRPVPAAPAAAVARPGDAANDPVLTMSSRDIAELLGCRHDNVKQTIETLAAKGVIESPQTEEIPTVTRPVLVFNVGNR